MTTCQRLCNIQENSRILSGYQNREAHNCIYYYQRTSDKTLSQLVHAGQHGTHSGQQQLRNVLTRRFEKIAKKMTDFDILPYEDKKTVSISVCL